MSRNWHCPCGCEHVGLSDEMARTCADYPRCHEIKSPEPQPSYVPGPYREIFGVVGGGYDPCPICGAGRAASLSAGIVTIVTNDNILVKPHKNSALKGSAK